MTEREFRNNLAASLKAAFPGAHVFSTGAGLYRPWGIPDLHVQIPPREGKRAVSFWIETKRHPARLSPRQEVFISRHRKAGGVVVVAVLNRDVSGWYADCRLSDHAGVAVNTVRVRRVLRKGWCPIERLVDGAEQEASRGNTG